MPEPTAPPATAAADPALDELRAALTGELIAPDDAGYERAREVFNATIDRRPAAIVRAADADDVARAIEAARQSGLELAVRGGGHSFAGHGVNDGGLLLDTSAMRGLEIDVEGRSAWAQAGLTAGEYTAATGRHGLATGFGDAGDVGVAGITLGGGIGWLLRKHGLTADSLLAAELVSADGELLSVDEDNHPDLFWALRGGGGNFGVVTRLRYRLHEVDTVIGGLLVLPASPDVLRSVAAFADAAPEELSMIVQLAAAPPMPMLPSEQHGKPVVMVMAVYAGDVEAGEEVLAPLRGIATPIVDALQPMAYPDIYTFGGGGPERAAVAIRSALVDELDDATIEALFEQQQSAAAPVTVQLRPLGGAMARVPADATAFAHRDRRLMLTLAAMGAPGADGSELDAIVDDLAARIGLLGDAAYVNYLADEGDARVREAYPGPTYERLAEIKRRYDPTNLFRGNQNIAPAA
jgi:FAD/FMN-containing dehydrogenase